MKGGEKVESINIKALMKSEAYTEPKVNKTVKQENNNEFSKIINKKLSEEGNNTKVASEHEISEKSSKAEDPKLKNDTVEADVKTEDPKVEKNTNEQLIQLMQLLIGFGDKAGIQDADKLKQIISELLLSNISGENKDDNGNNTILALKSADFKKLDINDLVNNENNLKQQLDVLASQIAEKLSSNPDFRTQLISKLSGELQGAAIDNSKDFKQAIIKELSSLLKQGSDSRPEDQTLNIIQSIEKAETEANKGFNGESNNYKPEVDNKTVNKEDKLLKDLLFEDGAKDRIANVVTRFEAIRNDKPLAVEPQLTISRNNLNTDFIKAVKFMDMNNIKELSVKILPKDLGEIVIRLSMDNGVMKANISASNKETYNLLNSQLTTISNQLADQNMNIQSFNLSLSNGDNFLFSGNGNDQGGRKQQGKKATLVEGIDTDETPVQGYDTEESSINALA
jgi:flagellar hook-length control protein FliK